MPSSGTVQRKCLKPRVKTEKRHCRGRRRQISVDVNEAESVQNDVSNDNALASQTDCDAEPVCKRHRRSTLRRNQQRRLRTERHHRRRR